MYKRYAALNIMDIFLRKSISAERACIFQVRKTGPPWRGEGGCLRTLSEVGHDLYRVRSEVSDRDWGIRNGIKGSFNCSAFSANV